MSCCIAAASAGTAVMYLILPAVFFCCIPWLAYPSFAADATGANPSEPSVMEKMREGVGEYNLPGKGCCCKWCMLNFKPPHCGLQGGCAAHVPLCSSDAAYLYMCWPGAGMNQPLHCMPLQHLVVAMHTRSSVLADPLQQHACPAGKMTEKVGQMFKGDGSVGHRFTPDGQAGEHRNWNARCCRMPLKDRNAGRCCRCC
jgi:hypothetical protein